MPGGTQRVPGTPGSRRSPGGGAPSSRRSPAVKSPAGGMVGGVVGGGLLVDFGALRLAAAPDVPSGLTPPRASPAASPPPQPVSPPPPPPPPPPPHGPSSSERQPAAERRTPAEVAALRTLNAAQQAETGRPNPKH